MTKLRHDDVSPSGLVPQSMPGAAIAKTIGRALRILAITVGLGSLSAGGYIGALLYYGNIHSVDDGILYRSGQLDKDEIYAIFKTKRIRSILNLRGAHPGEAWYDDELAMSAALAIRHYDYGISSRRIVPVRQIDDILGIIETAPKPLLVHCRAGADRAGLVAALYLFVEEGASAADADRQLSILYGHFPYLWSRTGAMDRSFWAFVASSSRHGRAGGDAAAGRAQ